MIVCKNNEIYRSGEVVSSLVNRPPNIEVGTVGEIVSRWAGTLYAVKMPNGDLYRWLDSRDLSSVDSNQPNLRVGDLAVLKTSGHTHSHFYHPQLESGTVVKIIKIIESDFYDVKFDDLGVFGWFTGFELSAVF